MKTDIDRQAEDIVRRSRAGDQNATAMIVQVRKAAMKGNKKAKKAFDALKSATSGKSHEFGAEGALAKYVPPAFQNTDKKTILATVGGAVLAGALYGFNLIPVLVGGGVGYAVRRLAA